MINLTAHSVSIFKESDCHLDSQGRKLLVNPGVEPVLTVPAGEVVNIKFTTELVDEQSRPCDCLGLLRYQP